MSKRADLSKFRVLVQFTDEIFTARIIDEPDIFDAGHGNSPEEALDCLAVNLAMTLEGMAERG